MRKGGLTDMDIWNPWHGCRKYSEGCENCYMFYLDSERGRYGGDIYRVKTNFNLPVRKDRHGNYKVPSGSLLHVCMTSDFFLEEADGWRDEAWDMIRRRDDVTFWIQTKRAERIERCLPHDWGNGWKNVIMTVTAENQSRADERIPILLSAPAHRRAVMCAPMIGGITLSTYLAAGLIELVIVDGENYAGRRALRCEWVEQLYLECLKYGVNFNFAGTGNVFVKDGKTYSICRAYHRVMAARSGFQIPPAANIPPVQKKCRNCWRNTACGGCRQCGKCMR